MEISSHMASCLPALLLCTALCAAPLCAAELRVAPVFSDHAVLQRDMAAPVWGTALPGETVTVSFAGQNKTTKAEASGQWRITLDPVKSGHDGPLTIRASSTITLNDIQVGDVWICAGDAFMGNKIQAVRSARAELGNKTFPAVRLFRGSAVDPAKSQGETNSQWITADRTHVGDFPAVAYFFAKAYQLNTGVPVGIIELTDPEPVHILRGGKITGSTVEAWISDPSLRALPEAKPLFDYYDSTAELRDATIEYEAALGDWKLKAGKAFGNELKALENREPDVWYDYLAEIRKAGKPAPADPPRRPTQESLRKASTRAGSQFRGLVAPLSGLAVRGVAINLGLANAPRATQCSALFPCLLNDWRKAWNRPDLPFVIVQQARVEHPNLDPRAISELREAQAATAASPHTALARTTDLSGKPFPEDVQALAQRMYTASQNAYSDSKIALTGPAVESVSFEGAVAVVRFKQGTARLTSPNGSELKGFTLTERPNRWVYANARIDGDRVVVSHPGLKAPTALRYDWIVETGHEGNLTDESGLPALPYRSDRWPAFTDTPAAYKPNAVATIQPTDLYPVPDPSLPRVLLIGDSIMNGYSPFVVAALKGKATIVRMVAFGMIGRNDQDAAAFCAKLKDGDYALIHYNDGLHSLPPRITDEQFGIGLSAMLKHLKTVTPHVIWATTTPAPDKNNSLGPDSQNSTVITRNAMSVKIAADHAVPVNDLYKLVIDQRETLQGFANLHFTPEGSQKMGLQITQKIRETLGIK
jgi:sialate O-acetylesterase